MKKLLTLTFSILFSTIASLSFAETTIDDVCKSLTSNKVTTGNFTQEKKAANLKRPLKSTGTFIFSEDGIAWQNLKPFKTSTIVTKDSIIQITADGKKNVTDGKTNETFKSAAATLSSLFAGDKSALEKMFVIKSFEADAASWKMNLTPKDQTISQALKEISLSGKVSGKTTSLDGIKITQNETDSITYTLANQTYKQELSSDEKALFKK